MESLLHETGIAQERGGIHHADVKERTAVGEIAQVDEIALVSGENDIPELEVAMERGVRVGRVQDEPEEAVLLRRREERILRQLPGIPVFHAFEDGRVHMR